MSRILLLEDNDGLADSIQRALELRGHTVAWFRNLHEARATIPPIGFQVLLCDYELPDGTGLEFLADVERSSFQGLTRWTTILWSGLNRAKEVEASGLAIQHVGVKDVPGVSRVLELLEQD